MPRAESVFFACAWQENRKVVVICSGIAVSTNAKYARKGQKSARTIGGAGTGKTAELIKIVEKLANLFQDPCLIGFVSLTRAARREASERAATQFGWSGYELEREGWFRTLHSVCYRMLGVSAELVTDDVKGRKWLAEVLGEPVGTLGEDGDSITASKTDAGRALLIWKVVRSKLCSVKSEWERARRIDGHTPDLLDVCKTIEHYEQAKRLDGRLDFEDLLGKVAGYQFTTDGPEERFPDGQVPELKAWILDEAQDISPLSGAVFKRLIDTESCKYVYLSGDPFQAIYTFSGADHRVFMEWPIVKERVAPKSWRCPKEILNLGEQILSECSDYWNREIQPADHSGELIYCGLRAALQEMDPNESWLVICRAGYQAAQIGAQLDKRSIPWHGTKGGGWLAPKRDAATNTLLAMERNQPIAAEEWPGVLKFIKLKQSHSGHQLIERGTKAKWANFTREELAEMKFVAPDQWQGLGITDYMADLIRTGAWRSSGSSLIPYAARYYDAVTRWGYLSPERTKIRVGTIHSVKGAQAENVILLTTTTQRCIREANSCPESADAEHRVWYVGATRARKRLIVAREDAAEKGRKPEVRI